MKIYLTIDFEMSRLEAYIRFLNFKFPTELSNFLFFSANDEIVTRKLKMLSEVSDSILYDSGAFTLHLRAMKQKAKGTFNQAEHERTLERHFQNYLQMLHKHSKKFELYANFDVIEDPERSAQYQSRMEKQGLRPMPVYHRGTDLRYLKYYLENYEYVGIGGFAYHSSVSWKVKQEMLKDLWRFIYNVNPNAKIHGFGLGRARYFAFPWCSIDTSRPFRQAVWTKLLLISYIPEEIKFSGAREIKRQCSVHIADLIDYSISKFELMQPGSEKRKFMDAILDYLYEKKMLKEKVKTKDLIFSAKTTKGKHKVDTPLWMCIQFAISKLLTDYINSKEFQSFVSERLKNELKRRKSIFTGVAK